MLIYVDIDETICETPVSRDYTQSRPIVENIEKINKLFLEGHTVIYWTARGTVTGKDWSEITKKQLSLWKALYSDVKFGKPAYDVFICDKAINSIDFFKDERIIK
jgi:hypothetical protein